MRTRFVAVSMLVLAANLGASARAQALVDPMRPPAYLPPGAALVAGPVLQSIYISPDRRYAMIDGTRVAPGERFGDARVVRISETEVALEGARGTVVLSLHPGVQKRVRGAAPAGASPEKGRQK